MDLNQQKLNRTEWDTTEIPVNKDETEILNLIIKGYDNVNITYNKNNINNINKEVAIKILRPDIEKLFNEELDALMLLAYIIENTISKAKRLKLVEIVCLLREIVFSII